MLRQALQRAAKRREPKARRLDERGVGEHVGGLALRADAAVGEDDRAVGVLGHELHVVRHDEDGRALVVELAQQPQQLVGTGAVLAEGRLVEGEHGRPCDECGADREPPLLASREEERVRLRLGTRARSARACARCASRTSTSGRCRSRRPCASSSYTVCAMNWCSGFWKTKPTRDDSVRASLRPTSRPPIGQCRAAAARPRRSPG